MREVKFRGLSKRQGWVYGYFWKTPDGTCFIKQNGEDIEVDEKSVGQLTGLKDKNGVEIYDGDIVRCFKPKMDLDYDHNWVSGYGIAKIANNGWKFYYDIIKQDRDDFFYGYEGEEFDCDRNDNTMEVIGNIYQNPDLLN